MSPRLYYDRRSGVKGRQDDGNAHQGNADEIDDDFEGSPFIPFRR